MPEKESPCRKLLVATTNKKKLSELRQLLAGFDLEFVCLADFPGYREVPETGKTFQENASLKAASYAKQTGLLTLAEDSGLCCDSLEGAPGVYSARFAGESKEDQANNAKLLRLLEKVPDNCRGAHFVSTVALATPERLIGAVEGTVHGVIHKSVAGSNGFGYDPVFFYLPFGKTFGEVPPEMKNKVSHRSQALAKARQMLEGYLTDSPHPSPPPEGERAG